jgi:hypothetical protein
MMKSFHALLTLALVLAGSSLASAGFTFKPGHIYTTNYYSRTINQHDTAGRLVASLALPSSIEADELRGIAFGPDGNLYTTAVRGWGFAVLVLNESGTLLETYPMESVYVRGNLGYGKLAVSGDFIYVTGQDDLIRFRVGMPNSGASIFSGNQIFDVVIQPDGNLFVAAAYRIYEVTASGELLRTISGPFTDIRGVEFDPVTNKLFVTHLGHSNFFSRLMRVDAATGDLEDDVTFGDPNDIFLTESGELLVGSRFNTPRIYSQDLEHLWTLQGDARMFVTQYPGAPLTLPVTLQLELERSGDLTNWEQVPVTPDTLLPTGAIHREDDEAQGFYRLQVRRVPPSP